MSVHSSGSGSGWLEDLDVDQEHGNDFVEFNDIRIGTRLRMGQEHSAFADSTAGGIHRPGRSSVLGIHDGTPPAADGTALWGHGIVWDNTAVLWCSTAIAGASTSGDPTVLLMHPDKQWAGGDVTWRGAHEFDASVDITGPVWVDGSCDFSDVQISGDLSVAGIIKTATDVSVSGDIAVDGTSNFTGDVAVAADLSVTGYIKADATISAFGKGVGIELFYDPTVYAAAENMTFPNGLIMKTGVKTLGVNDVVDVSFAVAFAATPRIFITSDAANHSGFAGQATSPASTGFTIWGNPAGEYSWLAIGR